MNNLKQIYLGLQYYVGDKDGHYPVPTYAKNPGTGFWWDDLEPYLGDAWDFSKNGVWICPTGGRTNAVSTGTAWVTSYAINGWAGNPPPFNIAANEIPRSSDKLLVADGKNDYVVWSSNTPDTIEYRHDQAANVLWCDGHVGLANFFLPIWQARWDTVMDP